MLIYRQCIRHMKKNAFFSLSIEYKFLLAKSNFKNVIEETHEKQNLLTPSELQKNLLKYSCLNVSRLSRSIFEPKCCIF